MGHDDQCAINFSACAVGDDKAAPKWKQILRVMVLRRLDRVPWISILELREMTACQSADVRVRELRRKLDHGGIDTWHLSDRCIDLLNRRKLFGDVHIDDLNSFGGMACINSSIATFRVRNNDGLLWVYLLTLEDEEIKHIVGDIW